VGFDLQRREFEESQGCQRRDILERDKKIDALTDELRKYKELSAVLEQQLGELKQETG
jgi:hypothetical protein